MMCVILERPTLSRLTVLKEKKHKKEKKKKNKGWVGDDVRKKLAWRISHPGSWTWPRR
jgi:hypothetical protein